MPYTLNGQSLGLNNEPQLKEGTMWVPLRDVAEAMGAKVDFDPDNGVAIVYHGDHMITTKIGDAEIDVDGNTQTLQEAPYVENGETWVPVRFFNTALNMGLNVDLGNNGVDFTSGV